MRGYATLPKDLEQEIYHWIQLNVVPQKLFWEVLVDVADDIFLAPSNR